MNVDKCRACQIAFFNILNLVARKLYKRLGPCVDWIYKVVISVCSENCGFQENT